MTNFANCNAVGPLPSLPRDSGASSGYCGEPKDLIVNFVPGSHWEEVVVVVLVVEEVVVLLVVKEVVVVLVVEEVVAVLVVEEVVVLLVVREIVVEVVVGVVVGVVVEVVVVVPLPSATQATATKPSSVHSASAFVLNTS